MASLFLLSPQITLACSSKEESTPKNLSIFRVKYLKYKEHKLGIRPYITKTNLIYYLNIYKQTSNEQSVASDISFKIKVLPDPNVLKDSS